MIRSSVNLDCFISVSLKVTDPTHFWRKFRGSGQDIWNLGVLRAALKGSFSRSAWLKRHLRFVAPRMWLCRELATRIDTVALARIANVRETRFGLEIELRGSGDLTALEVTLEPILPLSE